MNGIFLLDANAAVALLERKVAGGVGVVNHEVDNDLKASFWFKGFQRSQPSERLFYQPHYPLL